MIKKKKPKLNIFEIKLIEKLKNLRIKQLLTQEQLAEKVGLSRVSIAELETFRKKPNTKIIEKISRALDFPDYVKELKNIVEEQNRKFEEDTSNFIENRFNPIPLSKKIIINDKELAELNKKAETSGPFVFVPGRLASVISKIKGIYAYKMNDTSMEPAIKKGDFLIIKYLKKNLWPDDVFASGLNASLYKGNEDGPVVAISDMEYSYIRRMKKVSYYLKFSGQKTPNEFLFFQSDHFPDTDFYEETEWDDDNRIEGWSGGDSRTFSFDDTSDFRISGIVIMTLNGNLVNRMDIDILLNNDWINES